MLEEGLIDPRQPVGWRGNGKRVREMRESQIRPGPVEGVFDQSRTDRVAEHVAQDCEEMAVVLNGKTFEAALPDMPVATVVPMVATDMTGQPPLHEGTERALGGGLDDEMKMVGHQTESEQLDGMFRFRGGKQVETCGVVAVLVEDRGATVAAIQRMVDVAGHLSARNPRHGNSTVRETGVGRQGKVACPLFSSGRRCLVGLSGERIRAEEENRDRLDFQ